MSENDRPHPDSLLAQIDASEASSTPATGRLKVFFGAAPGVGKTYAMLEEARKATAEGIDVLIGYAEPHIRPETEALLLGLEILPYKLVEYRDATFKEFDLERALTRKPKLICVDELAHRNAPGLRHEKRWQDVFDLLDAGIDVYATLNVQHLESVNDIVERITGVVVKETIPDAILDRADEIELIDTTPEELTQRLREGKVYRPDVAERAIRQFFNKGNLTALRELALRRTAERVDAQMREQRQKARVRQTWAASDRLLVCIGPSPLSARLVRSAGRLARSLRAPWSAVYVETVGFGEISSPARDRISAHQRLAQQLGGDVVTLSGEDVAQVLTDYARDRNVTRIIIGKPDQARWRERLFGSIVDDVIRRSGDIDVYVIRGETTSASSPAASPVRKSSARAGYFAAVLATAVAAGIGWVMHRKGDVSDTNVLMLFLLVVLGISWRYNRRASVFATVLGVLTFDFVFVQPYFSFAVSDRQYVITFLVMLVTGLIISTLVRRTRAQAELFRRRQNATQAILDFTDELSGANDVDVLAQLTAARLSSTFNCDCGILLRAQPSHSSSHLRAAGRAGGTFFDDDKEQAVARWVLDHAEAAGAGTATLPLSSGAYIPLRGSGESIIGVVAIRPRERNPLRDADTARSLESLATQAATAIERAQLTADSRAAWERLEQENLRNTLLSAVSHDLRTPLTAITGAASALVEPSIHLSDAARFDLASTIVAESDRMERVISNLLDISRLEAGGAPLRQQPVDLKELIHAVIARLGKRLEHRAVSVHFSDDLPEILCDPLAMDQVLTNLLENAADHTPPGSPIDVDASHTPVEIILTIADRGPGFAPGSEARIFEKFVRLSDTTDRRGLGLGLAICQAIVRAHGGSIVATNREGGGAVFRQTLPRNPSIRGIIPDNA